jgi:hypothetical protein
MEILKLLNELSAKTLNAFYHENISDEDKQFIEEIKKELQAKGYSFNLVNVKESIIRLLQDNNYKDGFIDYIFITENQNPSEKVNRFFQIMLKGIFQLFSEAQTSIDNKAFKKEYYETQYKTAESIMIQTGKSIQSLEILSEYMNLLKELIETNSTSEIILHPKQFTSPSFFQHMIGKLVEAKFISEEFKNDNTQINWIKRAFHVEFYVKHRLENFQLKINWNNQSRLADWLLFLKEYCVVYENEDNKKLLDWLVLNVKYKNEDISKDSSVYKSIKRALRKRKNGVTKNMFIDNNGLFNYKKNPSP